MMTRAVVFLCVLASAAHASSLDGNHADEQAQRRLSVSYERVYTFHSELLSWRNAREACSGKGGSLATAHSEAENDKIFEKRGETDAWIGLTDLVDWSGTEGTFVWQEDESPVTYQNWAINEPSNTDGIEHCVLILADKTWNDNYCGTDQGPANEKYPYICQKQETFTPTRVPTPEPSHEPTRKPIPAPSPMPTQPSPGTCFHGDGKVLLESGASTRFSELTLGERIKTSDGRGGFSFNPVLSLPHKNNTEPALFLTLTTETGKQLDMTSDHYIPKCEENHLRFGVTAGELVVGDCLLTADGKETLTEISSFTKNGVFTAITEARFLVVDGVVASAFSKDSDSNKPELDYEKYLLELQGRFLDDDRFGRRTLTRHT